MKNLNKLEIVGMVLGIIGSLMIILNVFVEDGPIKEILGHNQLVFWLGILLWALGHARNEGPKEREEPQEKV